MLVMFLLNILYWNKILCVLHHGMAHVVLRFLLGPTRDANKQYGGKTRCIKKINSTKIIDISNQLSMSKIK
jgi:hypothetical protein